MGKREEEILEALGAIAAGVAIGALIGLGVAALVDALEKARQGESRE